MNPAVKSKLIFISMLLFSSLIVLQMGLYLAHQIWDFQLKWNVFQYCLTAIKETYIGHDFIQVVFNFLILYTISRILWRCWKQVCLSWKWNSIFRAKKHHPFTNRLNYEYLEWKTEFLVIQDDTFIALTMGLFRPKIIVSTGLFKLFTDREVKAILLHEQYHCRHYDPLKQFLSSIIVDGMGYVPMFKAMARYYKTWKELLADRFSMRHMGSVYDLGEVLLKLSRMGKTQQLGVGVYFADAAINYRILQVLEPDKSIRVPFFQPKTVTLSLLVLFLMSSIVIGGCA